jgi:hypothetical protein
MALTNFMAMVPFNRIISPSLRSLISIKAATALATTVGFESAKRSRSMLTKLERTMSKGRCYPHSKAKANLPFFFAKLSVVYKQLGNAYSGRLPNIRIGICQTTSQRRQERSHD